MKSPSNFEGLVLGCIDSYDSNQILIFSGFSRSTRFAFFCTAQISKFQRKTVQNFAGKFAFFSRFSMKICDFSAKFWWNFAGISQKLSGNGKKKLTLLKDWGKPKRLIFLKDWKKKKDWEKIKDWERLAAFLAAQSRNRDQLVICLSVNQQARHQSAARSCQILGGIVESAPPPKLVANWRHNRRIRNFAGNATIWETPSGIPSHTDSVRISQILWNFGEIPMKFRWNLANLSEIQQNFAKIL